jgi:hypothetical protein
MNEARCDTRLRECTGGALRFGVCLALMFALPRVAPVAFAAELQPPAVTAISQQRFATPEAAAAALIDAAERFDVKALQTILGADGTDLVVTNDPVLDKNQGAAFAEQARAQSRVMRDATNPQSATLFVGLEEWPMPIPIVEEGGRWRFDSAAGRTEILYRRIGRNELDAIEACRNYVSAQHDYALQNRAGSSVNQYAQRIISTPGKKDGLVWRTADGTLEGPLAPALARMLAEGYTERYEPFHGYYFKILTGQGPDAPLGQLDYVLKDVMIGGFALVAAPAEYAVTGVKSFIVSQGGVVYERDLGEKTLEHFRAMKWFNPSQDWEPVVVP